MLKRFIVGLGFAALSISTSGCFLFTGMGGGAAGTPMPAGDVEKLTTCTTGDMGAIKKNLMLAGYTVISADEETIQTDFKQIDSGYGGKEFVKVTAVRLDDTTVKFKVRVRNEGMKSVDNTLRDGSGHTVATESQMVHDENETDEAYYLEAKDQYESTKKQVCGTAAATST